MIFEISVIELVKIAMLQKMPVGVTFWAPVYLTMFETEVSLLENEIIFILLKTGSSF